MKGVQFLNTEFQENEVPELYSVDVWDLLMNNTDYIYIDSFEALIEFNTLYFKFEETHESPFYKPGAYMWDHVYEEWINTMDNAKKMMELSNKMYNLYFNTFYGIDSNKRGDSDVKN